MGTDETSWVPLSSICETGWVKGEGEMVLWLTVSDDELDREGDANKGGVEVELSGECTPLAW